MGVLEVFFGWPAGGVWSNLLASALWVTPALFAHHKIMWAKLEKKLDAHHKETMREVKKL